MSSNLRGLDIHSYLPTYIQQLLCKATGPKTREWEHRGGVFITVVPLFSKYLTTVISGRKSLFLLTVPERFKSYMPEKGQQQECHIRDEEGEHC